MALPAGRSASLPADAGATAHKPGDPTRQAYVLEALRWLPDPVAAGHDIAPVNDVQAASAAPETIPVSSSPTTTPTCASTLAAF